MAAEDVSSSMEPAWRELVEAVRRDPELAFATQWSTYRDAHTDRADSAGPPIAWCPSPEQVGKSNIAALIADAGVAGYAELHAWSARERGDFWRRVISRLGIVFDRDPDEILDSSAGADNPVWLPGARMNAVESCFLADPDAPAIVAGVEGDEGLTTVSYGELSNLVDRVARGLLAAGFVVGDAIALYMPMTTECVAAYLGIVKAGLRVVSIADSFAPDEVRRRVEIVSAKGIVTVESYLRGGREIRLFDKVKEATGARAIVISSSDDLDLRDGDLLWDSFLVDGDSPVHAHCGKPYDATNILFSSGTTGDPKAIPWTHLTPLKCAMDGHFHQDIHPGEVVAWPTNIGWMMGPWLIYATFINRGTMALYEGAPVGPGFARFIRDAKVAMLGVVPALVRAWRTSGACDGIDWSGIRVFSSTGEPSNREDYLWLMSRTGYRAPVIEYLGGTEIGGGHVTGTVVQPASPATFTTPALGLDFVILDDENRAVDPGRMGQLYLVPPSIGLSQTLLNRDHHEVYYAGAPSGPNGELLRRHGDEISRLPNGFFRAQGRADDTMNLGGIKVSSLELEQVLDDHPAVYESAAVAVQPTGEGAEELIVFAVLESDADRETLSRELRKLLASRLNPLFKIREVVVVESLPRTASNKLMRRKLRARYVGEA